MVFYRRIGLVLMISGAIITGIAYTEITPPNFDENFDRYLGANVMRLIGPLLLGLGTIILFGSCCFFAFAFYVENMKGGNGGYVYHTGNQMHHIEEEEKP
ncbi:hypothetical protein B4U79_10859 [Dinothrombium tinctorium]|uniref:Uncharacterized protein n=1 Tax=Dinothrombium tinctorium TaxID=1965070 RepID=A0A3S3PDL2_9ACAR|nr:hypothetical protein B4U79_10859 [Dinothrombium tinctorium]